MLFFILFFILIIICRFFFNEVLDNEFLLKSSPNNLNPDGTSNLGGTPNPAGGSDPGGGSGPKYGANHQPDQSNREEPSNSLRLNNNPTESNYNPVKTDTDHLYEYLVQYEGKKIKDTNINLRFRRAPVNGSIKDQYYYEISRIYANVRKEHSDWFTYDQYENPRNMFITKDFLNKIINLKKDYLN